METRKEQPVSNIVNKRLKEIAETMVKTECTLMYDTIFNCVVRKVLTFRES